MKTYEGRRTIDGLVVTVDGKRLDEHYDVKRFTKYGFEWTYEGESPQQLALAILYDFLGDKDRAVRSVGTFYETGGRQSGQRLGPHGGGHRYVSAQQSSGVVAAWRSIATKGNGLSACC